jgi:hypothetical protein
MAELLIALAIAVAVASGFAARRFTRHRRIKITPG